EGLVAQARASSLPTLAPAGTYTRLDSARRFQGMTVLSANQYGATAPLAVPLIAPAAWAQWAHALDDRRVAELGVGQVRRQVAIAVANAYLTVVTQRRLLEVAMVSRDNAASHADYTRQQAAAGAVSELDDSLGDLLRTGRSDIRLGYQSLEDAQTRVTEARAAATLAHRALEISTLRYRQGATTNIEVIDAEQQARQSDLSAALAEDSA